MSIKFIDDEYEYLYDEEYTGRQACRKMKSLKVKESPVSKKGHQKKHGAKQEMWDEFLQEREEEKIVFIPPKPKKENKNYVNFSEKKDKKPFKKEEKSTQQTTEKKEFTWGPNTREIKGNKIDFDRVDKIEKIENDFNGKKTFGIKFSFSGKKGLSKTVWFNQNVRERDSIYNTEYAFWMKNKKKS